MKHRLWQRLVSAVLTAAMVVTMLPLSAFAADTNPPSYTLSYYNYVKLHALSSPVRVLATNYATANKSRIYEPLIPGELSYVKFALDYNGNVDINVYTQDGTLLGPVYGARYAGHVTGKPSTGYESKNMSEYQIQQTLRTLGKGGTNFRALTNYAGIGLTGEPAAYRTLAQYYEYHGLENPFEAAPSPTPETTEAPQETSVPTPTAPAEATETPEPTPEATEIPAATEEPAPEPEPTEEPVEPAPSEEPSAPVSSAQPEETTAPETESAPDESAPVSESAPIAEAAAMNTAITEPVAAMALTTEAEPQEATSAEQEPTSEPVATEAPAASEEPVATPEPSDAPEATAAPSEEPVSTPVPTEEPAETAVPSEEPTASPEPSEEPAAEDEELSETEKPSFTHEELQEIFQLTDEEVANFTDADWDEFASLAADEDPYNGVPESELPEDFFIESPDYEHLYNHSTPSMSPFSLEGGSGGGSSSGNDPDIIHNYFYWNGRCVINGTPTYLPAGNYTIKITPRAGAANKTVSLNFTVAALVDGNGNPIDPSEIPPDELEQVIQESLAKNKDKYLTTQNGFPAIVVQRDGDPVDMVSGALEWSYTDLTIDGEKPLTFARTYVSYRSEIDEGGIGRGWSHNWSYKADVLMGEALIQLPNGGSVFFQLDPSGNFATEAGNIYSFRQEGDNYLLTNNTTGATVLFNKDGAPVSLTESDGTVTNFTCDGEKLVKVSNDTGSLSFAWDGDHILGWGSHLLGHRQRWPHHQPWL